MPGVSSFRGRDPRGYFFLPLLMVGSVSSVTVKVVVQLLLLPAASTPVTVIVWTSKPTSVPAAGLWVRLTPLQLSDVATLAVTSGMGA